MKVNVEYKDGKIKAEGVLTKGESDYLENIGEFAINSYSEIGKILKKGKSIFGKLEIKIKKGR